MRIVGLSMMLVGLTAAGACLDRPAGEAPRTEVDTLRAAVDTLIAPYESSNNFSGIVLVSRAHDIVMQRGYGQADFMRHDPVEPATRFRIGSLSKSFTAALVLRLRDRGALALDDRVADHIPSFPHGRRITVRHLLAHRSGLANYFFDPKYPELSQRAYDGPASVTALAGGKPLQFEPGSRFAYNNINYSGLAWLVEAVSKRSFDEMVRRELLTPLGLRETGLESSGPAWAPSLAQGHDLTGLSGIQRARPADYSLFIGAGSMLATARDVARWIESVTGGRVLDGQSLTDLLEFAVSEGEFRGHRMLSVSGWDGIGFGAHVLHLPDEALTVVALCNLNVSSVAGEIARGVAALALGDEPETTRLASGTPPDTDIERLAGHYRFGDDFYVPGGTLKLVPRDGHLLDTSRTPHTGLLPLTDGDFLYRATWARVRFLKDDDGRVTGLRFGGRFVATRVVD